MQIFMPPQPAAPQELCFCHVRRGFHPAANVFLSLCKDIERIFDEIRGT